MLKELFYYLTTPCPTAHRRLGYLSGLIAIQGRYQRVAQHWHSHLDHSQQLILQAVSETPKHDKVVVLGSGLLLDVPLEALTKQFKTVVLVDIAHLIGVRRRCRKLDNVILQQHDITGLAEALLTYQQDQKLPRPNASLPAIAQHADLIISCNLLSQLPITPSQYLQQRYTLKHDVTSWQQAIIADHLALLANQLGRRVLLCDRYHNYLDPTGKQLQRDDMLHGIELGEADQQWQWLIAPLGELDPHYQLQATVLGLCDWFLPKGE